MRLAPSLLAISFMVGLAFVTRYSGMDTVLGLSLTRTGPAFPFFGTLLGWLGVALTGTDAGSNALFGNLQKVTAERLGISPDPDGRGQLERRRDGQDDRRPVDRRRRRRDPAGRPRGRRSSGPSSSTAWSSSRSSGLIVTAYAFVLTGWIPQVPAK